MKRFFAAISCSSVVLATSLAVVPASSAQGYPPSPPPPPTPNPGARCAQTGYVAHGKFRPKTTFHPGNAIAVRGVSNCVAPKATVRVSMDPAGDRVTIGSAAAGDQGQYIVRGTIPRRTSSGTHVIQAVSGRRTYSNSIEVTPAGGRGAAAALTSPAGLIGTALALLLIALAVVLAPRRRRRTALHAASDVPRLDTSGFVPFVRKGPVRKGRKRAPANEPAES
jgi:hypothetical protein